MNTPNILLFLADGFEDLEALAVVDILRRGGADIATVSINANKQATSAHNVTMLTDLSIDELPATCQAEALVLPGGMPGAENLFACKKLMDMLQAQVAANRCVAAICASPGLVLGQSGLLNGHKATTYPSFERFFTAEVTHTPEPVVVDGNFITAQGPAFAYHFAFAILEHLKGKAVADEVKKGMLIPA